MKRATTSLLLFMALLFVCAAPAAAQTTGTISGTVQDEKGAAIAGATLTARHVATNTSRTAQTDSDGRYRLTNMPVGSYEITVEAVSFAKYVQTGVELLLNQDAVVNAEMKPAGVEAVVNVTENAALLNTANAEVSTRFDSRRLSELPLSTNRSVYNVALSAPGISQVVTGQSQFASQIGFSANGGRVRSNNFMIDGQDNNDFGVAGATVGLNNPDLIQEVRLVTNQFTAEFGRNGSAVFNAITKSGGNEFHGSGFWFHNDNALNACSNLNKAGGFCRPSDSTLAAGQSYKRPFRIENQLGGTLGGPLHLPRFGEGGPSYISGRDRTFFFFSLQRWWDRQLGSGFTINGVPNEAGRAALQAGAGTRPHVAALLRHLPAGNGACTGTATACAPKTFVVGGQTFTVPVGSLTGSTSAQLNNWQQSIRIDHNLSQKHSVFGRYIFNDNDQTGSDQATPPGLSTNSLVRSQAVNLSLNSLLSSNLVNELRGAYQRQGQLFNAADPRSEEIPSIEISALGLTGFNAASNRTAIGLAVNLPQFAFRQTYQLQDNISVNHGNHALKFGVDLRRNQLKQFFVPTIRGRLVYSTLQRFVDDIADSATVNKPLAGGREIFYYDWHDVFAYGQTEWKVRSNFTLTLGLRYESPGQPIGDVVAVNDAIVAAAGGDERFRFGPVPKRDNNNFQPRIGFNWNPRVEGGPFGWLAGGDRLVIRGGYAVTHDYAFTNIASNIASSFPFVAAAELATSPQAGGPGVPNAFATIPTIQGATGLNPNRLTRTIVGADFRSPYYQQYSLEMQRELTRDTVLRVGYVGTKGTALFQTIDGNPRRLGTATCTETDADTCRVNRIAGVFRLRGNAAASIYHSAQFSLEKRLSRGFSAGAHYTWSSFIDTASEIFNPSGAEVAVSQDSFNRSTERARSSFDRPHRFTGNFVYELPWMQDQNGFVGHVLGGWQMNAFFTFQDGSPFTVLQGTDPAGALSGISGLVGNAIRPNINTNLPLGSMSIEEIRIAGGVAGAASFFTPVTAAQRVGNAGRNILRTDGINRLDFGLLKNTRITETQRLQIRADFFNFTNTRDFGVPEGRINNANFLNQWGTNGGNRRVIVGLRYVF
jgi:hypothetical protein